MLHREVRLTPTSFGFSHMKDMISVDCVSLQYNSCTFKVRRRDLSSAPPSHSSHDCHCSFTQTDHRRTHCGALPSFLPLAPPQADATSSPPSTFSPAPSSCCWPHSRCSGNIFAVDAPPVPVVFLIPFRLFGEWGVVGGARIPTYL